MPMCVSSVKANYVDNDDHDNGGGSVGDYRCLAMTMVHHGAGGGGGGR